MDIFWNVGEGEKIVGVDILGIRAVDQALEAEWVAGITTVTPRARYIGALPWFLCEYYERELAAGAGSATWNAKRYNAALSRLEFVILAASRVAHDANPDGIQTELLGPLKYGELLDELLAGKPVEAPEDGASMEGIYAGVCRSLGLLAADDVVDDGAPAVTERGRELWSVRAETLVGNPLVDVVFDGGQLNRATIEGFGTHFSANTLAPDGPEHRALFAALTQPFSASAEIERRYGAFAGTVAWIKAGLGSSPRGARDLLTNNLARVSAASPESVDDVSLAWFTQEVHRRVHMGLELLNSAFTIDLRARTSARVEEVVGGWEDGFTKLTPQLEELSGRAAIPLTTPTHTLLNADAVRRFSAWTQTSALARGSAASRAAWGLSLLVSAHAVGVVHPDPRWGRRLRLVFELLERNEANPIAATLEQLLVHAVIEPHLAHSLRKMSNGESCSLRFFPDGDALHAIQTDTSAGVSGTRLNSVLTILRDLGQIGYVEDGFVRLGDPVA